MRSWVISTHGEMPTSCPTRDSRLRMVVTAADRSFSGRCGAELRREAGLQLVDQARRLRAPASRAGWVEAIELDAHRVVGLDLLAQAIAATTEILRRNSCELGQQ